MESTKQIAIRPERKTAVMVRREMLNNPAVMGVLGPVERAVFLASTAKTIAEYSGTELTAELATALKWIFKDVGYRSTDEKDAQYLTIRTAEILKRYYANFTLKDFKMAFEMSITGELDDYLPKGRDGQPDRNHYQQFNAEYVCKILNAYKGRRAAVLNKANEAIPEAEPVTDEKQRREIKAGIRKDFIECFYFYRDNGYLPPISPIAEMLYYNIVSEIGFADEIVVTIDEQKAIFQRTINEYARIGNVGDVNRLQKEGPGAEELKHDSFALARRKALKRSFERIIKDGIVITDYVKI